MRKLAYFKEIDITGGALFIFLSSFLDHFSGVTGHFPDGPSPHPWVSIGETASELMAPVVGKSDSKYLLYMVLVVDYFILFYCP